MKKLLAILTTFFVIASFCFADEPPFGHNNGNWNQGGQSFVGSIQKGLIGGQDIKWWDGVNYTFLRDTSYPGVQMTLNEVGSEVDALMAYGSGAVYTDSTISAALSAVGSTPCVLVIRPGAWTIGSNITIPSTMLLKVESGATLTVGSGVTLTVNGGLENNGIITGAGNFTLGSGAKLLSILGTITCSGTITYTGSVFSVGDIVTSPGSSKYYGTNSSGVKGWYSIVGLTYPTAGVVISTGIGWDTSLPPGAAGNTLVSDGTNWGVSSTSASSGTVVQVQNYQRSDLVTLASTPTMVVSDTIPTNTQGTQVLSVSITPKSSTNELLIQVHLGGVTSGAQGHTVMAALFQDSTANALSASVSGSMAYTGPGEINFSYYMAAGTASSTTFTVRAADPNTATAYINGTSSRIFGGTCYSSITVTEIQN